jgi:lysine-specific demethylase 8
VPFDDPGASRHIATLKTLLRFPNYFPQRSYGDLRIWMGGAGQVSTIHNDNYHNLNAQLYGKKTFLLFAPDQYPTLYTQLMNKTCWASPINPHKPDPEKYPLFENAEALEARLEPGDLLYIPIFWWHQATALTLSINVTMFSYIADTQYWSQA